MKNVYIQVYSVRNEAQKDFVGSLKRIAEIGYAGVEFAGHGGLSASEMKKVLTDLNLDPISSHIRVDEAEAQVDYVAEAERELSTRIGRACRIAHGKKKGRIEIEYYDTNDLNDLLEALHKLGK